MESRFFHVDDHDDAGWHLFRSTHLLRTAVKPVAPNSEMVGVRAWCADQFGPESTRWRYRFYGVFLFRAETDAFHFKMRWC